MNLDEKTFGDTPGAMYLARALNDLNSQTSLRSAGKRITATRKQVNELENSFFEHRLSAKTVANCLRLMRFEISEQVNDHPLNCKERLIEQLIRNVQIGYIKRGIRLCSVARKAERKLETAKLEDSYRVSDEISLVKLFDSQSKRYVVAGMIENGKKHLAIIDSHQIETVTPELLMERSDRRCKRLGKPHVKS